VKGSVEGKGMKGIERSHEVDNKGKRCVKRKKRGELESETRKYICRGRNRIPGFEIKEESPLSSTRT
jgi:hypothetical protein